MREVKCQLTGEVGSNEEFYKAPNGKYYKTKEMYEDYARQVEYTDKITTFINKELLHTSRKNCEPLVRKLIKDYGIKSEIAYKKIKDNYEFLNDILKQTDSSISSKIFLIFSVTLNGLTKPSYAGCYEIRNNITNEVYVGESIDVFKRIQNHISDLYENKHHCFKLQEAFNENHSFSNFTATPLFMFPIACIDKNEIKHDTLYLEAAFYLINKRVNKALLYNTKSPYLALKNNNVRLDNYEIDCQEVLKRLIEDKYNVLPPEILEAVKKNLNYVEPTITTPSENNEKEKIKPKVTQPNKHNITNILREFAEENIIPQDYSYNLIRECLVENGLITIDEKRHTVATDYSLENNLYTIKSEKVVDGLTVCIYYITDKGKDYIRDIFINHKYTGSLV